MRYNLTDKIIIVTGATSGIGFACVKDLVKAGAVVIGVGRNENRNRSSKNAVLELHPNGKLEYLLCDFSVQSQVRKLAEDIRYLLTKWGFDHIDGLINNAGVYLEKKQMTEDGIEMTFAVNHLGQFLLTHQLLSLLLKAENGKVLTTSSYSHRTTPLNLKKIADPFPYIGLLAYKRSKLCNVLFSYELNRRFPYITAFAVDPGLVNTGIASKGSNGISNWVWRTRRHKGTSPELPVRTYLYLLSQYDIDTSSGYYFKNCEAMKPSQKAVRKELAEELWDISCKYTNCHSQQCIKLMSKTKKGAQSEHLFC